MGPQALFKIFMEIREKEKEEKNSTKSPPPPPPPPKNPKVEEQLKIAGVDPVTGIYDSSDYQHTVLNMSKITGQSDPVSAKIFEPCVALAVTKILENTTDFFKDLFKKQDESERKVEEEFKDFIAQCLLNNAQLNVSPSGGDE